MTTSLADRVWRKVDKSGDCWIWTGGKDGHGYGHLRVDGRSVGAHRLVYTLSVGPIPDGLVLDHLCCNPPCVNPAHLEPVTSTVNVSRGALRRAEGRSDSAGGLVGYAIREHMAEQDVPQSRLSRLLGISQTAMSRRLSGEVPLAVNHLYLIADFFGVSPTHLLRHLTAASPTCWGRRPG